MAKLTKRTVDAIRPDPSGRDAFLWDAGDGALKGFGVRMKPSGVGSFLVQYRNREGRTRRLVLGRVDILPPELARGLAREALRAAAMGSDPSADRHAARRAMTVAVMCDGYLRDAESGRLVGRSGKPIKASTLAMDRSRIERHVKPLLGRRTVAGLTAADIRRLQADIAEGKTATARAVKGRAGVTSGGRGVAARTVTMLAAIMKHAGIEPNPARGVERFAAGRRKRFLTIEEIAALGMALRAGTAEGLSRTGIAAIRGLLLTGCRRNEILALPAAWLDARSRCIRFEDSKTGRGARPWRGVHRSGRRLRGRAIAPKAAVGPAQRAEAFGRGYRCTVADGGAARIGRG